MGRRELGAGDAFLGSGRKPPMKQGRSKELLPPACNCSLWNWTWFGRLVCICWPTAFTFGRRDSASHLPCSEWTLNNLHMTKWNTSHCCLMQDPTRASPHWEKEHASPSEGRREVDLCRSHRQKENEFLLRRCRGLCVPVSQVSEKCKLCSDLSYSRTPQTH